MALALLLKFPLDLFELDRCASLERICNGLAIDAQGVGHDGIPTKVEGPIVEDFNPAEGFPINANQAIGPNTVNTVGVGSSAP